MCALRLDGVLLLTVLAFGHSTPECLLPRHPSHGRHRPHDLDCPNSTSSPECHGTPNSSVPEGWLLFVTCNPGYKVGDEESQGVPTVCGEGKWSPKLQDCVYDVESDPFSCALPEPPVNGRYEVSEVECSLAHGSSGRPGAHVTNSCVLLYHCSPGHQLTVESEVLPDKHMTSVCANNTWTPSSGKISCASESTTITTSTSRPDLSSGPDTSGCELPQDPQNRLFCPFLCDGCASPPVGTCSLSPGSRTTEKILKIQCQEGYRLQNSQEYFTAVCVNDVWIPEIPKCLKTCPALESDSLFLECQHGAARVDCGEPTLPNTTVTFQCKPSYAEYPGLAQAGVYKRTLTCRKDGRWSYALPECEPACGVSKGDAIVFPTIVHGSDASIGEYPWHAGLYRREGSEWSNICGGSLISTRIVMTAAHCVEAMMPTNLRVALGKYHRSWTHDEPYAVRLNISAIIVPREYSGSVTTYAWDIALLVLGQKVQINSFVMPVCRDVNLAHHLSNHTTGYVVGWGKTSAAGNESETLRYSSLSLLSPELCRRKIPKILAFDKLCGSKHSESVAEKGDSGGGLTAVFNGLHYIFGVVSLKYNNLTIFTNISWTTHKSWLATEINNIENMISLT